jgi:riboflavin synthase
MFTGIIHQIGKVQDIEEKNGIKRFEILNEEFAKKKKIGDSISINGACHTIVEIKENSLFFDSIPETLKLTNLGTLEKNSSVNLEESLTLQDAIDGHLVTGHIDDTCLVLEITEKGGSYEIKFELKEKFAHLIALKGSVAINGVSLTVSTIGEKFFGVSIIPHTWQHTNLGLLKTGQTINLEVDLIMRYLERLNFKL